MAPLLGSELQLSEGVVDWIFDLPLPGAAFRAVGMPGCGLVEFRSAARGYVSGATDHFRFGVDHGFILPQSPQWPRPDGAMFRAVPQSGQAPKKTRVLRQYQRRMERVIWHLRWCHIFQDI